MKWQINILLYYKKFRKKNIQSACVTSSLLSNYFLHFAGSWDESEMIKSATNYVLNDDKNLIRRLYRYNKIRPKAKPKGLIRP